MKTISRSFTKPNASTVHFRLELDIKNKNHKNYKIPTTPHEKELSRKDRIKFFLFLISICFLITPFILVGLFAWNLSPFFAIAWFGILSFIVLLFLFIVIVIWKTNPYFPYQVLRNNSQTKTTTGTQTSSESHLTFNHHDSLSSSFSGNGGSFGGGGSSGRW